MEDNVNPDLNSLPVKGKLKPWHIALPLILLGVLAFVVPASPFSAAGKSATCLDSSRQVLIALAIYSGDFDDRFPSAENWQQASSQYLQGSGKCPTGEYAYNPAISNLDAFGIANPGQTPVLYDGKGNSEIDFRHSGQASIGLADGSSKSFSKQQADGLAWTPSLLKL